MLRNEYTYSGVRVVGFVYLYVFMEWLFLVTKPSFLGVYPWPNRGMAFLIGVWPYLIAALLLHSILCAVAWWLSHYERIKRATSSLIRVMPAFVVASLVIILIDNFTYTTWRWGIVESNTYIAPIYWLLFLGCFAWMVRRKPTHSRVLPPMTVFLVSMSIAAIAGAAITGKLDRGSIGPRHSDRPLPNIVMFASDGANADHLSAYGYARKTTPSLDAWIDRALVADNAFTNSAMTAGSLTAMMTGKYSATTKVFYPPQALQGRAAYQQLPEVLHTLGYESLQETIYPYADAMALNWQDSFNYANGRKLHWSVNRFVGPLQIGAQLARRINHRFASRAGQLLLIRKMVDSHAAVTTETETGDKSSSDQKRMEAVADFIRHAKSPFFIHIHLMGTHLNANGCCMWSGTREFNVQPGATTADRNSNALDNAIFQSDKYFGQLMTLLQMRHVLGNTIVVYTSDHATGWDFRSRVPLIFLFPNASIKGRIEAPTQLIDVAPTLLDYLGFKVPSWMEGRSLLSGRLDRYYPIYSSYRATNMGEPTDRTRIGPPVYNLAEEGLVVCDRWYILTLRNRRMWTGSVSDFKGACDAHKLPSVKLAQRLMIEHLRHRGFRF